MARFVDCESRPLRKGFYGHLDTKPIIYFYFNGDYNEKGMPIIDNEFHDVERHIPRDSHYFTKRLYKLTKKEVKSRIINFKDRINFLEKSLEDLKK